MINKKRKRKNKETKDSKHFLKAFTVNFGQISLNCIIYRTSVYHAQVNRSHLKLEIDYLLDKISFQSTKQIKKTRKETLCFYCDMF